MKPKEKMPLGFIFNLGVILYFVSEEIYELKGYIKRQDMLSVGTSIAAIIGFIVWFVAILVSWNKGKKAIERAYIISFIVFMPILVISFILHMIL